MSDAQEELEYYEINMKIIQINLNHCEAAQDLLPQTVVDVRAYVVLINEPYEKR